MTRRQAIRFGVVTAWARHDWHSRRLLAACGRRGVAAFVDPADLAAFAGDGAPRVRAMNRALPRFDAFVLARGLGRSGDPDVQFEIYRALEASGAVVVNRIDALLAAQDKFRTSWLLRRAGIPTPRAAVAQTLPGALAALGEIGEAVVKPVFGSLGEGVARLRDDRAGRRALRERLARDGAVYLQSWIENPGRDLRVFVVGGEAAAAMERRAAPGEWVTNLARGGRPLALGARPAVRGVAERAARALGLDYAGVDVIEAGAGPTVIEVNGNPSWRGILEATGVDMADPIAQHVLDRALRRRGASGESERWTGATHG